MMLLIFITYVGAGKILCKIQLYALCVEGSRVAHW